MSSGRWCSWCGDDLPLGLPPHTKFCKPACRSLHYKDMAREGTERPKVVVPKPVDRVPDPLRVLLLSDWMD